MPADPGPDVPLFEWVISGIVAGGAGAIAWMVKRIDRVETRMDSGTATATRERTEGEDKLWAAVEQDRKSAHEFRERMLGSMVTKTDLSEMKAGLSEMERRIMAAIGDRRRAG